MVDSNSVLVNVFYKYYVNPSDSGGILVGESVLPRSLRSRGLDFPASQAPAKRPPIPKGTACLTSKKDKALSCLVPVRSNTRVGRQAGRQSSLLLSAQAVLRSKGSGVKTSVGTGS